MEYNWQQKDWSHFSFTLDQVEDLLLAFSEKTGPVYQEFLNLYPHKQSLKLLLILFSLKQLKVQLLKGNTPTASMSCLLSAKTLAYTMTRRL